MVQEGEVEVHHRDIGADRLVRRLQRGEIFGEMCLMGETQRRHLASAIDEAVIRCVTEREFAAAINDDPVYLQAMLRHFAQRQTAWEQMMSMIALGTSNDLKYFLGVKSGRILTGWEEPILLSYVKYAQRPGIWFDATGGFPLQYWQVEPGQWASVALSPGDVDPVSYLNPRAMLIGSCTYDGVARTVKPSYEIKVPQIQSAQKKSADDYDPRTKPWTNWDYNIQGYRDIFYKGKWWHQEAGWHKQWPRIPPVYK